MTGNNEIWFRFYIFFYASIPSLLKSGVSGYESTFYHHRLTLLQRLREKINPHSSLPIANIPAAATCTLIGSIAIVDVRTL